MTTERIPESADDQVRRWSTQFDLLAESYDQTGVPFFTAIAAGLVERLAPAPGEHALDIGAGRGAATFPLAEAVGPTGRVDAIDVSPAMVELTRRVVQDRGLEHVHVMVGDATDPQLVEGSYDLVASSLVLFFLPDAEEALRRWRPLLRPGGRIGAATFRPWLPAWEQIEEAFAVHSHETGRPGPTSMPDVYAEDAAVEAMFREAGWREVRTEAATLDVPFADVDEWRRWSLGTAMRG